MAETVSNVYDLTFPSPITLKEISSIVVAVELWRKEIRAQLESKRLQKLDLKKNILLRTVLPNLPSTIYSLLEKYVDTFRKSVVDWQKYHNHDVFNDSGPMNVLSRFDNFAWDWDGTIHEERTAKRMILCDRFTQGEKFKIACFYCFEGDIKRFWPSASKTMDFNEINFSTCPLRYYWISSRINKFELHGFRDAGESMILRLHGFRNRSAFMYFWNLIPSNSRSKTDIYFHEVTVFARFILPKLNKKQLDIFAAANGGDLLMRLLLDSESRLVHVLPTWMYIRSGIDTQHFSNLIDRMLLDEAMDSAHFNSRNVVNLLRDIWESAPQHFKRSVLDVVLHDDQLLRVKIKRPWESSTGMKCLITVLKDADFEERNAFWHKNWRYLIFSTPIKDLMVMVKLSFRSENEITSFKEKIMSMYENIAKGCVLLLRRGKFKELNDFLSFCCHDEQRRIDLKQQLLRSNYIGGNSVLTVCAVVNNKLLNEFIDDAFQHAVDVGVEFRNQLASSRVTQNCLFKCIRDGCFVHVMEFVDTFFADEHVLVLQKKRLFEHFKEYLIDGSILRIDNDEWDAFIFWLLGSEDEVSKFKQSISVRDIFRAMMPSVLARDDGNDSKPEFPARLDAFLMWYFSKNEVEIEKFTKLFINEFKSFVPRERGFYSFSINW